MEDRPNRIQLVTSFDDTSAIPDSSDQAGFKISRRKRSRKPKQAPRGKIETRKLLAHVLQKVVDHIALKELESFHAASPPRANAMDPPTERLSIQLNLRKQLAERASIHHDHDEASGSDPAASRPHDTADWPVQLQRLTQQLVEILTLANKQDFHLFGLDYESEFLSPPTSPFRSPSAGQHSPKASPISSSFDSSSQFPPASPSRRPSDLLLEKTISVFQRLVPLSSEVIHSMKPSEPPFALQNTVFNLACVLLQIHSLRVPGNETAFIQIGLSLTNAFFQWTDGMLGRLLIFIRAYLDNVVNKTIQLQPGVTSPQHLHLPLSPGRRHELPVDSSRSWTQLHSICSFVLACILSNITAATASLSNIYHSHRIIEFLIQSKPEFYNDVLHVIAYTNLSSTRYKAISLLSTFWPRSLGHLTVGRDFPRYSYTDDVYRHESGETHLPPLHELPHDWIAWRFPRSGHGHSKSRISVNVSLETANAPQVPSSPSSSFVGGQHNCLRCGKLVEGFGLKCTAAHQPVHLHCLDSAQNIFQIYYKTDQGTKIGQPCYSQILPSKRADLFQDRRGAHGRGIQIPISFSFKQHRLRLVNTFTLVPCFVCRCPLWGVGAQGYNCRNCRKFAHIQCTVFANPNEPSTGLNRKIDLTCKHLDVLPIEEITLTSEEVQQDFVRTVGRDLVTLSEKVHAIAQGVFVPTEEKPLSMEQLASGYAYLWLQTHIYDLGIISGSIVVTKTSKAANGPRTSGLSRARFLLHDWLDEFEEVLESSNLLGSENQTRNEKPLLVMFSEEYLTELVSAVRSSCEIKQEAFSSRAIRGVNNNLPLNSMPISDILIRLKVICDFESDLESLSALRLAKHLHRAGYFERHDGCPILMVSEAGNVPQTGPSSDLASGCLFLFPSLSYLNVTDTMETLIVSIERCLADVDVSVQEAGLILLNTRCHPSIAYRTKGFDAADILINEARLRKRIILLDRLLPCLLSWLFNQTPLFDLASEQLKTNRETRSPSIDTLGSYKTMSPFATRPHFSNRQSYSSSKAAEPNMHKKESSQAQNITVAVWMSVKVKLADRYVGGWIFGLERWLAEVGEDEEHSCENVTLAKVIFQSIMNLAKYEDLTLKTQSRFTKPLSSANERTPIEVFDRALHSIMILSNQTFLPLKTKEGVLTHWLKELARIWPKIDDSSKFILNRNLQRLFEPPPKIESDADPAFPQSGSAHKDALPNIPSRFDPWRTLWTALTICETGERQDLSLALGTISILADSSCRVTAETLHHIISKTGSSELTIQACLPLAKLLYTSSISKNSDRMILASLSTMLLGCHSVDFIVEALHSDRAFEEIFPFVRWNFCAFLLNSGCDLLDLQQIGMIEEADHLQQLRTRQSQYRADDDFSLACDDVLVNLATSIILQVPSPPMYIFCARFLSVLLTEPRLHVGDLDFLIKRNALDLTQACWRLFHPSLSLLAGARMTLLLRVANVDPEPFEKILSELRDTQPWQERYQQMDSLINILAEIYGSSSLDPVIVSHSTVRSLARAIMRFVSSYLWDERESLRQKAEVLFTSLNSVHLQRLATCLQTAFNSGRIEDRKLCCEITNFAIQTHNNAPDWQIFPIQLILEKADEELLTLQNVEDLKVTPDLWRSLVYLGCLYAAAAPIRDQTILVRLKYHIARALGFENCSIRIISLSEWRVEMGKLVKQHEEADLLLMFSGLLQVLDSPHHIEVDETALLAAGLQSIPEPPKLLSTVFIDLIPKIFEAKNDAVIRSWGYLLLRKSIEGIHIICSKQPLEDRRMNWVENDMATALRGITRQLLCDIAFDTKTLIITTCNLFFTRFPKRVIAVLAFQVITMLDFMTQSKPGDIHTAQIRGFLRTAFRAYAARGLFSLLWRHDMITIISKKSRLDCLAEVMNDGLDAIAPDDVLADLPVKDILRQGLKAPKEHIGLIFANFCSFIAKARFSNLPLSLLDSLGHFLHKLSRHFADLHDWSVETINFDPLLNMAAVLLAHNKPSHLQNFCYNLATLIRSGLCRFNVTSSCLEDFLEKIILADRRQKSPSTGCLVEALGDTLVAALHDTSKMAPLSLGSLAEALSLRSAELTSAGLIFDQNQLTVGAMDYLFRTEGAAVGGIYGTKYSRVTFEAQMNIAILGLTCGCTTSTFLKMLEDIQDPRTLLCLLSFFVVSLPRRKELIHNMLDNGSLDRLLDMTIDAINLLSAQSWLQEMLAFIFAAIHAWWILLAVELPPGPRIRQERFWTGIWPAIYDIMLPMNPAGGSAVHVVLWSSFCDLVSFMHQVDVYGLHDVIPILDEQLEVSNENDPVRTKILRTLTALTRQEPKVFLSRQILSQQLTNQLFTAVKLKRHLSGVM